MGTQNIRWNCMIKQVWYQTKSVFAREGLQSKKRVTKLVLAIILVFTGEPVKSVGINYLQYLINKLTVVSSVLGAHPGGPGAEELQPWGVGSWLWQGHCTGENSHCKRLIVDVIPYQLIMCVLKLNLFWPTSVVFQPVFKNENRLL